MPHVHAPRLLRRDLRVNVIRSREVGVGVQQQVAGDLVLVVIPFHRLIEIVDTLFRQRHQVAPRFGRLSRIEDQVACLELILEAPRQLDVVLLQVERSRLPIVRLLILPDQLYRCSARNEGPNLLGHVVALVERLNLSGRTHLVVHEGRFTEEVVDHAQVLPRMVPAPRLRKGHGPLRRPETHVGAQNDHRQVGVASVQRFHGRHVHKVATVRDLAHVPATDIKQRDAGRVLKGPNHRGYPADVPMTHPQVPLRTRVPEGPVHRRHPADIPILQAINDNVVAVERLVQGRDLLGLPTTDRDLDLFSPGEHPRHIGHLTDVQVLQVQPCLRQVREHLGHVARDHGTLSHLDVVDAVPVLVPPPAGALLEVSRPDFKLAILQGQLRGTLSAA